MRHGFSLPIVQGRHGSFRLFSQFCHGKAPQLVQKHHGISPNSGHFRYGAKELFLNYSLSGDEICQINSMPVPQSNPCRFSPCRKYRYSLTHEWDDLFERKEIAFIGLNPSTADELTLDPTLTRIRGFCQSWGFNTFHMLNIFAFRSTDPKGLKVTQDPIGPENNEVLKAFGDKGIPLVFCWGNHGAYLDREAQVFQLLQGAETFCLARTKSGHPGHPLYLPADSRLQPF